MPAGRNSNAFNGRLVRLGTDFAIARERRSMHRPVMN